MSEKLAEDLNAIFNIALTDCVVIMRTFTFGWIWCNRIFTVQWWNIFPTFSNIICLFEKFSYWNIVSALANNRWHHNQTDPKLRFLVSCDILESSMCFRAFTLSWEAVPCSLCISNWAWVSGIQRQSYPWHPFIGYLEWLIDFRK